MGTRPLLRNARHRAMITPVNPLLARLIHISPRYWTIYRSFEIIRGPSIVLKKAYKPLKLFLIGVAFFPQSCFTNIFSACKMNAEGQHETKIYEHRQGPMQRARVNNFNQ